MEPETEVTKDPVLFINNESAKYVQPAVVQKSIATPIPSRFDLNLSRFTVKSLSSKHDELKTVFTRNDLPETITEVVEIPSSQSTPLVPPPDSSRRFSRLESITPDSSHPFLTPVEGSDPVLEEVEPFLDNNEFISPSVEPEDSLKMGDEHLKLFWQRNQTNSISLVLGTSSQSQVSPRKFLTMLKIIVLMIRMIYRLMILTMTILYLVEKSNMLMMKLTQKYKTKLFVKHY